MTVYQSGMNYDYLCIRSYSLTFSYGKQSLEVGLFLQKDLFFWPQGADLRLT